MRTISSTSASLGILPSLITTELIATAAMEHPEAEPSAPTLSRMCGTNPSKHHSPALKLGLFTQTFAHARNPILPPTQSPHTIQSPASLIQSQLLPCDGEKASKNSTVPMERRHMPVENAARRKQNLSARSIVPADLAG